jgi:hypothetical protein
MSLECVLLRAVSIKTSVYKEVVETPFDIFRETAKFAAKALIAGEAYDMMDKNRCER